MKLITSKIFRILFVVFFCGASLSANCYSSALDIPLNGQMSSIFLQGIRVYPQKPFQFDFLVDDDQFKQHAVDSKEQEILNLVKYFMAALSVPSGDFWVNLSPLEPDRIIPNALGETQMGVDLLQQDYVLKQLTASLMNPEGESGKKFWERIYSVVYEKLQTTDVLIENFNKVWIVPDKVKVYQNGDVAYISEAKLKVMLEEDYAVREHAVIEKTAEGFSNESKQAILDLIIPVLEQEVNYGEQFLPLRKIFYSMILATWYKRHFKTSLLGQSYVDQNMVSGIKMVTNKDQIQDIYGQYVNAFKQGLKGLLKEDYDPVTQNIVYKKYLVGGVRFDQAELIQSTEDLLDNAELYGLKMLSFRVELQVVDQAQLLDKDVLLVNRQVIKELWKLPILEQLKSKFQNDLERMVKEEQRAVIFFASDSDGFVAAARMVQQIRQTAVKFRKNLEIIYSLDREFSNQEPDTLVLYLIGHQGELFFENGTLDILQSLNENFGKIPFYLLDLAWDSRFDYEFLMKHFKFWHIDHHMFDSSIKNLIHNYVEKESQTGEFRFFNPHYYINDWKVADNYIVAAIIYDLLDDPFDYLVAIASSSENYQHFPEVYDYYTDQKVIKITEYINIFDLKTISYDVKALNNALVMEGLINNYTLDDLWNYFASSDIIRAISNFEFLMDWNFSVLMQAISDSNERVVFYEVIGTDEYGLVAGLFKRLRGHLETDERLADKVIVLYQHLKNNRTYYRAGSGKNVFEKVNLANVFYGNGVFPVTVFGGGHHNRAGGVSITDLRLEQEPQKSFVKKAVQRFDIARLGFEAVRDYIALSIDNELEIYASFPDKWIQNLFKSYSAFFYGNQLIEGFPIGYDVHNALMHRVKQGVFSVQYNPDRKHKRVTQYSPRAAGSVDGLINEFDFNQVKANEIFWKMKVNDVSISILANKYPYAEGHFLIVPEREKKLSQTLTDSRWVELAMKISALSSSLNLKILFNSWGAFATINHLHFHGLYYGGYDLDDHLWNDGLMPIETVATENIFKNQEYVVSVIQDYFLKGFVFHALHDRIDAVSDAAFTLIEYLEKKGIKYSMMVANQKIYIVPRRDQSYYPFDIWLDAYAVMGELVITDNLVWKDLKRSDIENIFLNMGLSEDVFSLMVVELKESLFLADKAALQTHQEQNFQNPGGIDFNNFTVDSKGEVNPESIELLNIQRSINFVVPHIIGVNSVLLGDFLGINR